MVKDQNGIRAKKIRELKNLTQDFVAQELGISQPAYSNIEKGQVQLKEDTLEKLSDVLGVSVDTLKTFDAEKYLIQNNHNSQIVTKIDKVNHVNYYPINEDIKNLYERTIKLLEQELQRYKDKFGEI
ncbi:MAG: helix-turn-helix transcriptional regulator [Ekhidna sp.]|nr:helix-turn-helix transcriptional regulator [Ekhidna sp.]